MSGSLTCSAVNCVHNVNGLCSANKIQVTGINASNSSGTQCGTFVEKSILNAITNMANMNVPGEIRQLLNNSTISMSPKIGCEASNCRFNKDRICVANRIQVMGPGANTSAGTQCETFI